MSATSREPVPTYPDLVEKVALVTGGSKGIGAAACRLLAANGARVAIVARGAEPVEMLAAELRDFGTDVLGLTADCTNPEDLSRVHRETEARLGPIELLVPFAGGFESFTPVLELELDEWRDVLERNLTSTFTTVREFLPGMVERRGGSIVTMSSISGRYLDKPTQAAYAAAKAGVAMFTRHLALEVGEYGVRANCVAPGTTMSDRIERVMKPDAIERTTALSPLGRFGHPVDTANATVFLLSDAASWLTGVTIDVNGGRVML